MPIFAVWRLSSLAVLPRRHSRPASAGLNARASRADCEGREEGAALVWRLSGSGVLWKNRPLHLFRCKTIGYRITPASRSAILNNPAQPIFQPINRAGFVTVGNSMSNFDATDEEIAEFIQITLNELATMARSITIPSRRQREIEESITTFRQCARRCAPNRSHKPIWRAPAKSH